ncbi:MAG: TonB-dependent receptor [Rikenellaceae bacterium]|nr:TonB-dependent receptor [Rikenellaceae bacterium]
MKIRTILFSLLLAVASVGTASAQNISGTVKDSASGEALVGATVHWLDTTIGVTCDVEGSFSVHRVKGYNRLVASYVGYRSDTIEVAAGVNRADFLLVSDTEIDEVVVESTLGNYVNREGVLKGETISFAGLCKMACCNLAESFENSASVTVGYSDAISGARQIKMLGLTGTYTQILDENRPIMRGLSAPYGLNYTPGMWLNSIQVSKGVSSVTAGHEAITGQINMEHRKPTDEERLFLNLYFDSELRPEINISSAFPITEDKRLSTVILAHGSLDTKSHDMNKDGFRDLPQTNQINIANKWLWQAENGMQVRWGWKVVDENRLGGEMGYKQSMRDEMEKSLSVYGSHMDNTGVNAYLKVGMPVGKAVYDAEAGEELRSNIAFVADYNYFKEDAYFGLNRYDAHDNAGWFNLMYAHYFSPRSSMIFGASAQIMGSDEDMQNRVVIYPSISNDIATYATRNNMRYIEPGVYAEYTYNVKEKFSLVLGLRGDYMGAKNRAEEPNASISAYYKPKSYFAVTPRSHIKWNITPSTVLRASAGMGYRRASIFTDNIWMLATGRKITSFLDDDIEKALTVGGSITQYIKLGGFSDATLSFDYFRTQLFNTVLADQELGAKGGNPDDEIWIYNTNKRSFTDTYQVDFQWTPLRGFDVFATFRYTNSLVTLMRGGVPVEVERPLTSRYKTLINLQYATNHRKWVFDATAQYNGPMRRPSLDGDLSRKDMSPAYPMFYLQVSHRIRAVELYVGCENIANYMQKDPILNADDPFSPAFNSSSVWGPLMGRKFYIGMRFNLY